eukprot:3378508-Alexandrium_andersonii.AAC.1
MSASLVGSEMCIRDSFRTGCRCRVKTAVVPAACAGQRRSAWAGGFFGEAVSYTHLTLPTICSV